MKVTTTNKKTGKKEEYEASGLFVLFVSILFSPVFLIAWGFGWASGTLLTVALTGFAHYMIINVVDGIKRDKKDSQDLHGS